MTDFVNIQNINDIQKPTFYNQFLPSCQTIQQDAHEWLREIQKNLSCSIQMGELQSSFSIWSYELHQYLTFYGFYFTKIEHLNFVNFYLSVLSITDLNYTHVQTCLDKLYDLLKKTHLITRDELTIDWRIIYHWGKLIFDNHDQNNALITLPKDIKDSFFFCVFYCSPYFSTTATQEILDEIRPQLCPTDWTFANNIRMIELFLPLHLPPNLHHQGFKLWLSELFGIWDSLYNDAGWELRLTILFSCVAWYNIGYINWEHWMPQIFTRILRGFSLPIGKLQMSPQKYTYLMYSISRWIVAMIGNGSSCLQYLQDLFSAIKSFYHPSNTGDFQDDLVNFVFNLSYCFVERIHLERKSSPVWHFVPHESYRLTEQNVTDFVNSIKDYAFISIFNKDHAKNATEACQYLSMLRPELIVPPIIKKLFESIDNINEPHRFTSIMTCVTRITRQLVRQTTSYSQGQTYVLSLIVSILPGIDINDLKKTSVTLEFLNTIFMLITCVDCSSAINIRNDLTEIEKEVCLSTVKFEDFLNEFLDRMLHVIKVLSADTYDATIITDDVNITDEKLESKFISIINNIVQQCSSKIFQTIRKKITNFLADACFSSEVRELAAGLVRALVMAEPGETLKHLLPKTCQSIHKIINESEGNALLNDHKGDKELTWHLILFSELVRARGDILLNYKQMIISVFHRCLSIIHKGSYKAIANAAKHLLNSCTHIYIINTRLRVKNLDEPFIDFLPIREWGQPVDMQQIEVQYHIPNADELSFVREFVEIFLYGELDLLKEKNFTLSNDERLRSLVVIYHIAIGCFRMVPRVDSPMVKNLIPSKLAYSAQRKTSYSIYSNELKLKENLRMRLLIDIGNLLDILVDKHPDDVSSIKIAYKIYSATSICNGVSKNRINELRKEFLASKALIKHRLCGARQNSRFLTMKRIALQIELFQRNDYETLTEIDKQVALKLFELSINRYSEIRRHAQHELFSILSRYRFSSQVIVDRIITLLNTSSNEIDHDQIKGCLYVLLGNNICFLPTEDSLTTLEKLWPALVRMNHSDKISTQNLINEIEKKINKVFVTKEIIQNINNEAILSAVALWRPIQSKGCEVHNQINIKSYSNLMENLSLLVQDNRLQVLPTWRQQKMAMSFLCLLLQKHVPIPLSCIRTFIDLLVHDNIELRKYATKSVIAILRLQKPSRIFIEKSLEQILLENKKSLSIVNPNECQPGDREDNLWVTTDDYKPPETQTEWEETCFLSKTFYGYYAWSKTIKYPMNKRVRYTSDNMPEQVAMIYDRFVDKTFIIKLIKMMILYEHADENNFNNIRFTMFKGLFRNFGLAFFDHFIEQLYELIHVNIHEKQESSHRLAAEITAGMIRGSKCWTLEMLDEFWKQLTPFLTEVCVNLCSETLCHWNTCFKYIMEHEDPRRMHRFIDFIHNLINNRINLNTTFNETSRWSLIQNLRMFQWRIPAIWYSIHENAKELLDHSFKLVRERIANVLAMSISFDLRLCNGKSNRQPQVNQCIDTICERLHKAIQVYEKSPSVHAYGPFAEIDVEARRALNLIDTVIQMHTNVFSWSGQPIKNAILRMFPYLCELESIAFNDPVLKTNLAMSRMHVAMAYLHENYLETLIEQLEQVYTSPKWHARQAAVEFIQNMIFCNLFNARPYAQQLHEFVVKCLFDERLEVRTVASTTLSSFYQCGYIQATDHYLKYFSIMAKTNFVMKIHGKKVKSTKNVVKRHGGILGLCAIVLSSPYDISIHLPDALMILCEHSHDPDPIQKSIKQCLSEFRRTHYDSWHEHQEKFTEHQLLILADTFISRSYYA